MLLELLQSIPWGTVGGIAGGAFLTSLGKHKQILERMKALEARLERQGELISDLRSENAGLRELLRKQGLIIARLKEQNVQQARIIRTLKGENREIKAENVKQADEMDLLRGDNVRLAGLLNNSEQAAKKLAAEFHESLSLTNPSHLTNRPPPKRL